MRVALGVVIAMTLSALPFLRRDQRKTARQGRGSDVATRHGSKKVRSREEKVISMRDATYAKDEARNARLQTGRAKST
jgi:hypothetical protein